MIRQCLKVRPQSRPHLEDILNHAWMTIPLDPPQTSPSPSISPSPSPSLSPSHSPSSSASGHPPATNCTTEATNQQPSSAAPPVTLAVPVVPTAASIKADAKMNKPTASTGKKSDELPPVNVNVNVTVSVASESVSSTGQSGASMESSPPPYL